MEGVASLWMWLGFSVFIICALFIDALVMHNKKARPNESMRAALAWSLVWIASALIFNAFLWFYLYETQTAIIAKKKALEFFTGYIIEKTLSIDNLFAFYIIFQHFRIPLKYQQRVFSYGVWSAIVMRLVLILLGVWLIAKFRWLLIVMGAFLLLTGIKMYFAEKKEKDFSEIALIKFIKRFMRVTHEFDGHHFFLKKNSLWYATPLFIALIFIEISDLVFASDSIPAIFAVTLDPFIIWTSNIFAILGLRALYFLLSGMIDRFYLLKYGIATILIFVGGKMVVAPWVHVPAELSLMVIASILVVFTGLSFIKRAN